MPLTTPAPCACRLIISVTRADNERPAAVNLPTPVAASSVLLANLRVYPRLNEAGVPNPVAWNFDDQLELVGYDVDRRSLTPGQTLDLALFWRPLQPLRTDYLITPQLRPVSSGAATINTQTPRAADIAPTQIWQVGRLREAHYRFVIPTGAALGEYDILVSVTDPGTPFQLPVNETEKAATLGRVRLQ